MSLAKNRTVRTKSTLHELRRGEFAGMLLIMVSNREPYLHHRGPGDGGVAFNPQADSKRHFDPIHAGDRRCLGSTRQR
jgi:hypothetical protein